MADVVLRLPAELRDDLKDPRGPVFTDADRLLETAGDPLIAIGDVVTYHLLEAGVTPSLSVVDGRTEREPAAGPVAQVADTGDRHVENPPATLSAGLLSAIAEAIESPEPVRIVVDGEEDLATVVVLAVAPTGATAVYGQPGEGMVAVAVTVEVQSWARALLTNLDGDTDRARTLLGF